MTRRDTSGLNYQLTKTLKHADVMGKSITSMRLHPRKSHMLVQTQGNRLLHFELRSFLVLNKGYGGMKVTYERNNNYRSLRCDYCIC